MKFLLLVLFISAALADSGDRDPYEFLKTHGQKSKPQTIFNEYEDIISGGAAFVIGNVGYFTTSSTALKLAYSGVQTVGVIGIGHGIYDYYYPHFETRMLTMLQQKKLTRKKMANDYVSLLGEMDRAKRISLLWTSSLLTGQYAINAFFSKKIASDIKDIYLFLGGVNAIIAVYSYFHVTDYEQYYLLNHNAGTVGVMAFPMNRSVAPGIVWTKPW